ncbi:MAG: sigma-70 family RNA polymerase sigma factor [Ignavibacteriaceae bacterium]|jgi:RNA polymerase sigma-70 factor (ECF subfamily)
MSYTEESILSKVEVERQNDFQNVVMPHKNDLYNYALAIVRNSDDAHDLVQETYFKAYKNYHQFESGTNSKAWMFMILKNTFINNYRKLKKEPAKVDYNEIEDIYENIKSNQTKDNNLGLDFYKNLLDDDLADALEKLPVKMKEVFLLCDLEGYTYEEIAEITDIPIGTVRSRLHRARKLLQDELFGYAKVNGYLN